MTLASKIDQSIRTIPDFPKPGIQFKDITPLLADPILCSEIADALVEPFRNSKIDVIAGVESRGFLFGLLMAQKLNCAFTMIRKEGKLPAVTHKIEYSLEYGNSVIELHKDAVLENQRVLIHDDLLATGGTAKAAAELVDLCKAHTVGFSFIVELDFLNGAEILQPYTKNIVSLINY